MRDNGKEDARKRGRGADKRGGAHSRYQFFRCGKIGGRSVKLTQVYTNNYSYYCALVPDYYIFTVYC